MTVDNRVFCSWPHFLSVDCRKSRNSSFSIFNRLFSYLYSAIVLDGFLPRCFGTDRSFSQLWIAYLLMPYTLLSLFWLSPAWIRATTASRIPLGYFFIPFLPDIQLPPDVVLTFSYIRGLFVYCPFLLDLFSFQGAFFTISYATRNLYFSTL